MLKFNNTHIFTGYLKQKLSNINIPTCKIYTKDFAEHAKKYGKEDPRIVESTKAITDASGIIKAPIYINYLKNNELYNYFCTYNKKSEYINATWQRSSSASYMPDKCTEGLTKTLASSGKFYDTATHEYLGDYLRFLRDYHNINLMSMYNCFNNNICNNIYYTFELNNQSSNLNEVQYQKTSVTFDSRDPKFVIYALPVKLFANYTIAIDSGQGVEMFCGLYGTKLDDSDYTKRLINKTYLKKGKTIFNQPFLYDKLDVENWTFHEELDINPTDSISRREILAREQDLKLFIKIPVSCKSSIVILEGNFINFNDCSYAVDTSDEANRWKYINNNYIINFDIENNKKLANINESKFIPISKLQLLAFNTGDSYPFADKLIEYLSGSVITSIDPISDNIARTQKVMRQNNHYFKTDGVWEEKIKKIIYDYIMNSGPIGLDSNKKLVDKRTGYLLSLGHTNKSMLYDILGYVDKDAEKWYANWKLENSVVKPYNTIQNIDIYNGLFDI